MTVSRRTIGLVLSLPVVGLLTGCNAFTREDPRKCPHIRIDAATAQVTRFAPGKGRDITDRLISATVAGVEGGCSYDKTGATVEMYLTFETAIGPGAGPTRQASFDYFVAMPAFYPAPSAKQTYSVTVQFPPNVDRMIYRDELVSIRIPLPPSETAETQDIYVGLQLTPEELRYNQSVMARPVN